MMPHIRMQRPRIKFAQPSALAPSKLVPICLATNPVPRVCQENVPVLPQVCQNMQRELYGMSISLLRECHQYGTNVPPPAMNVRPRSRQCSHIPATNVRPRSRQLFPHPSYERETTVSSMFPRPSYERETTFLPLAYLCTTHRFVRLPPAQFSPVPLSEHVLPVLPLAWYTYPRSWPARRARPHCLLTWGGQVA